MPVSKHALEAFETLVQEPCISTYALENIRLCAYDGSYLGLHVICAFRTRINGQSC